MYRGYLKFNLTSVWKNGMAIRCVLCCYTCFILCFMHVGQIKSKWLCEYEIFVKTVDVVASIMAKRRPPITHFQLE